VATISRTPVVAQPSSDRYTDGESAACRFRLTGPGESEGWGGYRRKGQLRSVSAAASAASGRAGKSAQRCSGRAADAAGTFNRAFRRAPRSGTVRRRSAAGTSACPEKVRQPHKDDRSRRLRYAPAVIGQVHIHEKNRAHAPAWRRRRHALAPEPARTTTRLQKLRALAAAAVRTAARSPAFHQPRMR